MDTQSAQFNMVEQQIRPWDVLSQEVLDVFSEINRGDFTEQSNLAYADIRLPIADNEVMLESKIEARVLQALGVKKSDAILEIGTGSGYMTAILASFGNSVNSIEINPTIAKIAQQRLQNYHNITLEVADVFSYKLTNSYDIIYITGAVSFVPEVLKNALRKDGKLLAFIKQSSDIVATTLIHRLSDNEWSKQIIFETNVPDLINAPILESNVFTF